MRSFKRQMGLKTIHLGLLDGDELIGGAIFYSAADNKGAGFLAVPDRPILPWHEEQLAASCMKLLLEAAKEQALALGALAVRVAPRISPPQPLALQGFGPAPVNLNERKTLYLDLQATPDELLQAMKPKGRYNIRLAERKGVTIYEESSPSAVMKFYAIMQQVSARDHFSLEPLSFFINLFDTLCPSGMAKVLFAEHEGDDLGALLMLTFADCATYLYGGTTNSKRNLMGGYALQWAAINKAKELGLQYYDFWGFDPVCAPDHSYAGFSRFKSQFGGEAIQYIGAHDYYFVDHLADAVIKALKEIYPDDTPYSPMTNTVVAGT